MMKGGRSVAVNVSMNIDSGTAARQGNGMLNY